MSTLNINLTIGEWVKIANSGECSFSLSSGGQYCCSQGIPDKEFVGHRYDQIVTFISSSSASESVYVKADRECVAIVDAENPITPISTPGNV